MNDYYGVIYKATNKINNKVYIGQTVQQFKVRKQRHIRDALNNGKTVFCRALRKYGIENFVWEVVDYGENKDDLDQKEIYWIKFHNSFLGNEGCNGYNMKIGGVGLSAELSSSAKLTNKSVLEMVNLAKTGEYSVESLCEKFNLERTTVWRIFYLRTGWNEVLLKNFTTNDIEDIICKLKVCGSREFSTKMSIHKSKENHHMWGKKGKDSPLSKGVLQIDSETGEILREFSCLREAADYVGLHDGSKIAMVCRGKRNTSAGFKWKYKEMEDENNDLQNCS
ncbi:GIY-YIG nuclease family protein [Ureibacillus chungkukjangi]|uniref:GIY-YIG nuclease family protein n=1 Tax=Ureibacillus chungkukjangi TaxID=1202712 RepID=UPI0020404E90|nr:GIY-YIG nuclease family protein [Ureibacillus chungkukjangi]MCM3387359.1 GIY-YIG nuclease family protein [Ureibacillus chungkukjangi]